MDLKRIKTDVIYFIEECIGMKLTSFQKEWLELMESKKRCCFMAFRSSGKTRQLMIHYPLWKALINPKSQYLVISKTLPQAIEVLKDIRLTIQTNPLLKTLIPSNRSQTWSRTEIELKNHSRILSKAYNENVRGFHVDGLLLDEIGEYDDHECFTKACLPTIRAKRGFLVCIGTPKSELDLLHQIRDDASFSSIYFDEFPAEGCKGNLFEERYPDVKIEHKEATVHIKDGITGDTIETYSNLSWSQEFLLKPLSFKDKLFPDAMIAKCYDPTCSFQYNVVNMRQYFMGVDFALSAQSGSDYTVITILEKSPGTKKLKIVNMERFRGRDYIEQKERIIQLAEQYQITKALGDEGSFGKTFIYDLKAAGLPIDGYKISSTSKGELVKTLRDQFEKEGFIIPYCRDDAKTIHMVNVMANELNKFGIIFDMRSKSVKFEGTGKHDDCVISLALANFIARHISMAAFSAVKGSDRRRGSNNPFMVASK